MPHRESISRISDEKFIARGWVKNDKLSCTSYDLWIKDELDLYHRNSSSSSIIATANDDLSFDYECYIYGNFEFGVDASLDQKCSIADFLLKVRMIRERDLLLK